MPGTDHSYPCFQEKLPGHVPFVLEQAQGTHPLHPLAHLHFNRRQWYWYNSLRNNFDPVDVYPLDPAQNFRDTVPVVLENEPTGTL